MSKYHKLLILTVLLVAGAVYTIWGSHGKPVREGLDLAGGIRVVLQAEPGSLKDEHGQDLKPADKAAKMDAVIKTIQARVAGFQGVAEPVVQKQGEDRVIVELPGIKDQDQALRDIQETAQLTFYPLRNVKSARNPGARWELYSNGETDKLGNEIYAFENTVTHETIKGDTPANQKLILEKVVNAWNAVSNPNGEHPLIQGNQLLPNTKGDIDPQDGAIIRFELNREGADKFADYTRRHVGEKLAIFLGDRMLTAPEVRTAITGGKGQITGFSSLEEAVHTASLLNSGALPVPLQIVQQDTVQATLGNEVVHKAIGAGIFGLILVLVFMLVYYRLPGLLADIALAVYALLTFAAFKLIGVTMTLPGIAGFILSIGMAVDANVLIFERLKEELRSGKTLRAAIDAGFSRAFTAIFDSNMCTAITTLILMWYGTGMVKSFALTLLVGVIISLFTAITVTRTLLHLMVNQGWAQHPWLFGVSGEQKTRWQPNVVAKRAWFFALSALVIVPGLVFAGLNYQKDGSILKRGIEFNPGTSIQVTFNKPITVSQVKGVVESAVPGKDIGNEVQVSNGTTAFIRTKLNPEMKGYQDDVKSIMASLNEKIGQTKDVQTSSVGPIISGELTTNAMLSVLIASVLIVLYLTFRFSIGGIKNGFKYGMCAIIATLHDVLVITGLFAILGYALGWEINTLFVTAVLTMIGFSTHDTIVVFDRIRENLRHRLKGETYEELANRSILQTFRRSINTSLTVLFTIVALLVFGGVTMREFYIALLVGIVSGTYSSIFNATPLLVVWEKMFGQKQLSTTSKVDEKPMVAAKSTEPRPMVSAPSASESVDPNAEADATVKVKKKKSNKKRF